SFAYCIREEVGVGLAKSFAQRSLCFPSQRRKPRNVEEFLRRPVWFRGIEHNLARITDHVCNGSSKFGDRQICARTNIDEFRTGIIFKDKYASICKIVDVQKLTAGGASAPYKDRRRLGKFRFMEATNESRPNMTVLGVIIFAPPLHIRPPHPHEVPTIFSPISFP